MSNQPPPPPPPPRPDPHPVNPSRPRYLKLAAGAALVLAVSLAMTPAHLGGTPYPYTTALVMFGLYLAVSLMQRTGSRSPGRAPAVSTPPAAGVTTTER